VAVYAEEASAEEVIAAAGADVAEDLIAGSSFAVVLWAISVDAALASAPPAEVVAAAANTDLDAVSSADVAAATDADLDAVCSAAAVVS